MDEISRHLALATESFSAAFMNFSEAIGHFASVFAAAVSGLIQIVGPHLSQLQEDEELREVTTPRQWHLYKNGSPRVRKKWRNALRRKKIIAEKRKGGHTNGHFNSE